jgi:hypothetical protein
VVAARPDKDKIVAEATVLASASRTGGGVGAALDCSTSGEIAAKLRKRYGDEVAAPAHFETICRNETQRAFVFGNLTAALHPTAQSMATWWSTSPRCWGPAWEA